MVRPKTRGELKHDESFDEWWKFQKMVEKHHNLTSLEDSYSTLQPLLKTGLTTSLLKRASWAVSDSANNGSYFDRGQHWFGNRKTITQDMDKVVRQLRENPWKFVGMVPYWTTEKVDGMVSKLSKDHPLYHSLLDEGRWEALIFEAMEFRYKEKKQAVVSGLELIETLSEPLRKSYQKANPQLTEEECRKAVDESFGRYVQKVQLRPFKLVKDDRFAGRGPIVLSDVYNNTRTLKRLMIELGKKQPAQLDNILYQGIIHGSEVNYSEEQQNAIKGLVTNRLALLTGYAGTGKTTVLHGVVQYLSYQRQNGADSVLGLTIAAKAAVNLRKATGLSEHQAITFAKLKWMIFCHAADKDNTVDPMTGVRTIIVDEVSMLDENDLQYLLQLINDYGCQLILVGDRAQLNSIKNPGALTDLEFIERTIPHFELTQVFRQGSGQLLEQVTAIRNYKPFYLGGKYNDETLQAQHIKPWGEGSDDQPDFVHLYQQTIAQEGINDGIIPVITATNDNVRMVNQAIQNFRYQGGDEFVEFSVQSKKR